MPQHPNSPLTPEGRRRLCERVDAGRPIAHVAAEAGISRATLAKWYGRWAELGEGGLVDQSSRPHNSPAAIGDDIVDAILELRRTAPFRDLPESGLLLVREPNRHHRSPRFFRHLVPLLTG